MYMCTFHYFNYYLPDFVTSICLGFIFGFSFWGICFSLNTITNHLWNPQALSLWSGNTGSKTLDNQRTNPREYQIMRTQRRKPLEYKTWHHPTTNSSTLCRTPHLNNKQNKNTNPPISRQDYHLSQPCPSKEKQNNSNKTQQKISPYKKLTEIPGLTLRG